MKKIKKYKWIIVGFFVLFLIIIGWVLKDLFLANEGALYGNRLDGREDVPITEKTKSEISDVLLAEAGVKKVTTNVHGIILDIIILVDDTMTVDKAKEIADEALTKCTKKQLSFYDVSVFINYEQKSDKKDFPIIGYKNKNSDTIVW